MIGKIGMAGRSPYSDSNDPYRDRAGFGAITRQNPLPTDTNPSSVYGLTRRGQLRGLGGLGDVSTALSTAKDFLFSSTGLALLLGTLAIIGYKQGWFEDFGD